MPLLRENRLYQTDWLLRFYGFNVRELLNEQNLNLDLEVDPKLSWALRNRHLFPVNINRVDKQMLLRIPGIGLKSVNKILQARKFRKLNWEHLKNIGIAMNRAKHFITCDSREFEVKEPSSEYLKNVILGTSSGKFRKDIGAQLSLF